MLQKIHDTTMIIMKKNIQNSKKTAIALYFLPFGRRCNPFYALKN
jgi:hypothetical protein